jgi:uncharacterized cupin superfamily protein
LQVRFCLTFAGTTHEFFSMTKKIDINNAQAVIGSRYPAPFDKPVVARSRKRLGDVAGLTQFGVNLTRLPAGTWSSQRHWHSAEDEFIYVLEGELVLVTDSGEEILHAGDCVGFKAGLPDGHHLQNRTAQDAIILEIGSRKTENDESNYPDIDLKVPRGRGEFTHVDGEPY